MHSVSRDDMRNAASTIAHLWITAMDHKDRLGVERLILAHAPVRWLILSALITGFLHERGTVSQVRAFEDMLFHMAEMEEGR